MMLKQDPHNLLTVAEISNSLFLEVLYPRQQSIQ